MAILGEVKVTYDDVLIVPQYSAVRSRSQVSTRTRLSKLSLEVPIIASNMDTITDMKMARKMDQLGALGIIHRGVESSNAVETILSQMSEWKESPGKGPLALSVGSIYVEREKARIDAIFATLEQLDLSHDKLVICVDLAHGDSIACVDTISHIRQSGFTGTMIAGSVCTPDACRRLFTSGANAIRVGIGNGSACSTRLNTGCGYPQFSAVEECAETGIPIIADGGIRKPGDAAKALAAGAKAVMLGGQFAGTDCVPGWDKAMEMAHESHEKHQKAKRQEWKYRPGGNGTVEGFPEMPSPGIFWPHIQYRGMASNAAKTAVGIPEGYEEGVSVTVKAKAAGSTEDVIKDMTDGIKSAMSYANSLTLVEFRKNAQFIRVSPITIGENRAHIKD